MNMTRRRGIAHCSVLLLAAAGAWPRRGAAAVAGAPERILVLGDSLSAEYGLARGTGWVALLEQRLAREDVAASVVNASISGDTTAGGRARLGALLRQHQPTIVILELGANDALRGLPLEETRANLDAMARAAKAAGARVVIVGMRIPPNYGRRYGEEFAAVFADVAREAGTALVPFMLRGVADVPESERLFQADRIHPVAAAHPTILDNIWPALASVLKTRSGRG
jgi:acyl-CoA thioesterase-1